MLGSKRPSGLDRSGVGIGLVLLILLVLAGSAACASQSTSDGGNNSPASPSSADSRTGRIVPCFVLGELAPEVIEEVAEDPSSELVTVNAAQRKEALLIARAEEDLKSLVARDAEIIAVTPLTSGSGALVGASIMMELDRPASFSPHRGRPTLNVEGRDGPIDPDSGLQEVEPFPRGSESYYENVASLSIVVSFKERRVHYVAGSPQHQFCRSGG